MRDYLDISPGVAHALDSGRPLVALESTIISHGMPFPHNLSLARELEAIVRDGGAEPATIAVINGTLRVGCTDAELERLATDQKVAKVSLRDLPALLALEGIGGTTVAATATIAAAAGIAVFATGGIGGVHRVAPGEQAWDVSADLTVLGREPVAVVCAGCKSVLDVPATLEVLETLGVTVLGFQTDEFPSFYTRTSGYEVDVRANSAAAAAEVIATRRRLGLPGGVLVCCPVPAEAALPAPEVEGYLARALAEAEAAGVRGRTLTPFLLNRLGELSGGRTLAANLALVRNNAAIAAAIGLALAEA